MVSITLDPGRDGRLSRAWNSPQRRRSAVEGEAGAAWAVPFGGDAQLTGQRSHTPAADRAPPSCRRATMHGAARQRRGGERDQQQAMKAIARTPHALAPTIAAAPLQHDYIRSVQT